MGGDAIRQGDYKIMVKKVEVDVEASLGYQANGRTKPTEKKDKANISMKRFICPECNSSQVLSQGSFGETVLCSECGASMYQSN